MQGACDCRAAAPRYAFETSQVCPLCMCLSSFLRILPPQLTRSSQGFDVFSSMLFLASCLHQKQALNQVVNTSNADMCRIGEECEQWVADLINACLHPCPYCRPPARNVLMALCKVGSALPALQMLKIITLLSAKYSGSCRAAVWHNVISIKTDSGVCVRCSPLQIPLSKRPGSMQATGLQCSAGTWRPLAGKQQR